MIAAEDFQAFRAIQLSERGTGGGLHDGLSCP
jgi:hypothetical protein